MRVSSLYLFKINPASDVVQGPGWAPVTDKNVLATCLERVQKELNSLDEVIQLFIFVEDRLASPVRFGPNSAFSIISVSIGQTHPAFGKIGFFLIDVIFPQPAMNGEGDAGCLVDSTGRLQTSQIGASESFVASKVELAALQPLNQRFDLMTSSLRYGTIKTLC